MSRCAGSAGRGGQPGERDETVDTAARELGDLRDRFSAPVRGAQVDVHVGIAQIDADHPMTVGFQSFLGGCAESRGAAGENISSHDERP